MAEEKVLGWDEVMIDETVTEEDMKNAQRVSRSTPVGLLLCKVKDVGLVEKTFKEYSCAAASLQFEIKEVLELERPVIGDDGKPVIRNGEPLMKVAPISGKEKAEADAFFGGMVVRDDVNLYNPKEKTASKDRRLFVAQKIGLLDKGGSNLTGAMWRNAPGKDVLIRTEWNKYKDKDGNEKKNVKVGYSGYEHISVLEKRSQEQATVSEPEIDLSEV